MDIQGPKRHGKSGARQRQMARRLKRAELKALQDARQRNSGEATPDTPRRSRSRTRQFELVRLGWQELGWYLRRNRWLWRTILALIVLVPTVFILSLSASNRIYPNVSTMGIDLGRMTPDEAVTALRDAWVNDVSIQVVADGEVIDTIRPQQIGLQFDAAATIAEAEAVGIRQGIAGTIITPTITLPDAGVLALQEYLLNMTEQINTAPYNAGFRWVGDSVVGVPGRVGRLLDIAPTLATVREDPSAVVSLGQLTVFVSPVQPEVSDPTPYLEIVEEYAATPLTMRGYDPFRDEVIAWTTTRDTFTSWLQVTNSGLSLRAEAFAPYIEAQIDSLNPDNTEREIRYLNVEETITDIRSAIARQDSEVTLRVRYRPDDYIVEGGDTASKIARKSGIPFYLIQQQNPGRDLNVLSIGDTLTMPTRDVTMPHKPIADKRIVVDLETQEMWAFENGQMLFNWDISSGRATAPTSPGIYQILTHDDVAYGSSFTLCGDMGCGQWEMYWFMGVYEVVPGLMNGFHGAVLLPNGAYLNGGATGYPSTFGCVMSPNEEAKALYDWAQQGTVVEIISREFDPVSDLAVQVAANRDNPHRIVVGTQRHTTVNLSG